MWRLVHGKPMRHGGPLACALAVAAGILVPAGPLRAAEETPEQLVASAKQAFDRKDYRQARRLASRVVARHATSPVVVDAWLVVVDSLMEERDLSRAYNECEKLLTAHPDTKHRTAILRREFEIGDALAASRGRFLLFTISRLEDGVQILERVIERAPYGPLADHAVYAIGEAYFREGDWDQARAAYDRLLKDYPNSELLVRARVRRAACNQKLIQGPAYDLKPVEEARRDMDLLAGQSGNERLATHARQMRDVLARGDYESGIFYFRRINPEAGVRYMKAVIARFPDSEYATRAKRILAAVETAAREETP